MQGLSSHDPATPLDGLALAVLQKGSRSADELAYALVDCLTMAFRKAYSPEVTVAALHKFRPGIQMLTASWVESARRRGLIESGAKGEYQLTSKGEREHERIEHSWHFLPLPRPTTGSAARNVFKSARWAVESLALFGAITIFGVGLGAAASNLWRSSITWVVVGISLLALVLIAIWRWSEVRSVQRQQPWRWLYDGDAIHFERDLADQVHKSMTDLTDKLKEDEEFRSAQDADLNKRVKRVEEIGRRLLKDNEPTLADDHDAKP